MQNYSSLFDIVLYFTVAGMGMILCVIPIVIIASCMEPEQQDDGEKAKRIRELLRLAAVPVATKNRQPISDKDEEIKIQKQLTEERERLRLQKEQAY